MPAARHRLLGERDEEIESQMHRLRAMAAKPTTTKPSLVRRDLPRSGSVQSGTSVRDEEQVAVETVRTGLVASLEADCLKYRSQIKELRAENASLQDGSRSLRDGQREKAEAALREAKQKVEDTKQQLRGEVQRRMELEDKLASAERKVETEKDVLKQVTAQLHAARQRLRELDGASHPAVAEAEAAREQAEAEAARARAQCENLAAKLQDMESLLASQQDEASRAKSAAREAAKLAEAALQDSSASADERVASATAEAKLWRERCEAAENEASRLAATRKNLEAKLTEVKTAMMSAPSQRAKPPDQNKPSQKDKDAAVAAKEAAKELSRTRTELAKVNELLNAEREKLAAQRAANRVLEEATAKEAARYAKAAQRAEQAEKRAAGAEAGAAELARDKEALDSVNGELRVQLTDTRAKLASLVAERRQAALAGDMSQQGVLSNSNFVKMVRLFPLPRRDVSFAFAFRTSACAKVPVP
eukprot:scaffold49726_cov27-Tisochrysis_lutea.AAC.2